MNVLVCDPISSEGVAVLQQCEGLNVIVLEKRPTESELISMVSDVNAIVVRSETKITRSVIAAASKLKVVGRAGVGVDNVDVAAATEAGVVVMNTPSGNTIATAELTCAMMLSLARQVPAASASMKAGQWDRKTFKGTELFGKTLGVVGMGRIGTEVTRRMQSFGMTVITFSPVLSVAMAKELGVEMVTMEEIYKRSDYITFHVPLTDETRGLINAETMKKMKRGVKLVNCARGGIIVEEDLIEALNSGQVGGAALDVYTKEPFPAENPLRQAPNLVMTPHLGASSKEAQVRVGVEIGECIKAYLKSGEIRNAVNLPDWNLDGRDYTALKPYLHLGEKLGALASQLAPKSNEKLTVCFGGKAAAIQSDPVVRSVLYGFLKATSNGTNYINVYAKAQKRGLQLDSHVSSDSLDFNEWLSVEVDSSESKLVVGGTFFGASMAPRIVQVNDYRVEVVPQGVILMNQNADKPGVVAKVSALLSRYSVNIANMTLDRSSVGGKAMMVLNLDGVPPAEVVEELKREPEIIDSRVIVL
jgi:D-3-phosphoglycerate dehydrogenase / 2-oxoglutarate reductase